MKEEQTCGACSYWKAEEEHPNPYDTNDRRGHCRRNPPQVVTIQIDVPMTAMQDGLLVKSRETQKQLQVRSMFPPMVGNDPGCGEYYASS